VGWGVIGISRERGPVSGGKEDHKKKGGVGGERDSKPVEAAKWGKEVRRTHREKTTEKVSPKSILTQKLVQKIDKESVGGGGGNARKLPNLRI